MWSDMLYTVPVAMTLSMFELKEDTIMDGDLQEQLKLLIDKYLCTRQFLFLINTKLKARIHVTYQKGTNLWSVLDGIIARYHLLPVIATQDGVLTLMLTEGAAWNGCTDTKSGVSDTGSC